MADTNSTADVKVSVRTLSGNEHILAGFICDSTIHDVKLQLSKNLGAPAFTLKLVSQSGDILDNTRTLRELGLAAVGSELEPDELPPILTLVRHQADEGEYRRVYRELQTAMSDGHFQEAKQLVEIGAGLDKDGQILKENSNTLLHFAIRANMEELAIYVVQSISKEDLDATNDCERTPLMQAVVKEQKAVIEAILARDPCLQTRDYMGRSVLEYALLKNDDSMVHELLSSFSIEDQRRAFLTIFGSHHSNPLIVAICADMPLTALKLLEADCWDGLNLVALVSEEGKRALHYAHEKNMREVIAALLAKGEDPQELANITAWTSVFRCGHREREKRGTQGCPVS
eukprot:TRINITY_DN94784_c0_g1_i1.p1 TRINITY_DN94784_c0_g1~~TRINITY_DN94784_c0_g1_i1.p1  ORF type:complete len:344 (-),score=56.29 TRINITY_DN94784_c0_g1_i1:108-1139(-)